MDVSKKRLQPKKELMKLVKDEIQLRGPKFNAAAFIDLVKDRVRDWIIMHGRGNVKPDKVCITNMKFEPGFEIKAMAQYLEDPWKKYSFYVYFNFDKKELLTTVMDLYVINNGLLTKDWDGFDYLEFDDKGHSYEVTSKEARIIDSYRRLKKPQPNDRLYRCKKCGTNFAANDLDIWLDSGLFCPVCKSKDIEFLVIEIA